MGRKKSNLHKGFFITFEGIEGTGKSTHIKKLSSFLKNQGYKVIITKEPGGTHIGLQIRKILLDPKNKNLEPLAELFLLLADRSQHIIEEIIPFLKKGYIVLSDRYADSSIAYQSAGRNLENSMVQKLNQIAKHSLEPNLTFLLDATLETSLHKVKQLSKEFAGGDRIENESLKFHKRVKKEYIKVLNKNKKRMIRIVLKKEINDTQKIIQKITLERLQGVK